VSDLSFCLHGKYLVTASEDCLLKLWDVSAFGKHKEFCEPLSNLRGHVSPVFCVAVSQADQRVIYSAGTEGVIRVWHMGISEERLADNVGLFCSHQDTIWQLVPHPSAN